MTRPVGWLRPLVLVFLATGAMLATPAGALDVSPATLGTGWGKMYDPAASGNYESAATTFVVEVGGTPVEALCADAYGPVDFDAAYTTAALTGAGASRAVFLIGEHSRIGSAMPDRRDEMAALQIAVWNVLQGTPLTPASVADAEVLARALELAGTPGEAPVPTGASPELAVQLAGTNATTVARIRLTGVANPAGQAVEVRSGGERFVGILDADGRAEVPVPDPGEVTARLAVAVAPGVALLPSGDSQPLVTAAPATVVLTATSGTRDAAPPPGDPATAPGLTVLAVLAVVALAGTGWWVWARSR